MQVCGLLELFIAESLAVIERVREEERWFNKKKGETGIISHSFR